MALADREYSIWIPGVPRSMQADHLRGYLARVCDAARAVFASPLSDYGIEIKIVFIDQGQRPDVDNVVKPITDALQGIVYFNDKQVTDSRSVAIRNDPTLRVIDGVPHATFAQLLDSGQFLMRVHVPAEPSIWRELRTS
jgi:hypothetical protein